MKNWFAVKTQPRRERQVCAVLAHRGVDTYFPLFPARPYSGRRRVGAEPLFPSYVFACLDAATPIWIAVRSAPGVEYFLGADGVPTPLPESLIASIRNQEQAHALRNQQPPFSPGDRVIIHGGVFDGLEAVFQGRLSAAGRVRVLLELVNRLVSVELPLASLGRPG